MSEAPRSTGAELAAARGELDRLAARSETRQAERRSLVASLRHPAAAEALVSALRDVLSESTR